MITSKQIINISENYLDSININGNYVKIYVNPTYDDVKEISSNNKNKSWVGDVRTIIDAKSQKVFVWDAYLSIHVPVLQFLGYPVARGAIPSVLTGYTGISNYKLIMSDNNQKTLFSAVTIPLDVKHLSPTHKERVESEKFLKEFFSYNWSFADKYLQGFNSAMNWFKEQCKL